MEDDKKAIPNNPFAGLPDITTEPRFHTSVLDTREVSPGVLIVSLEKPTSFKFREGQYIWLVLPERTKKKGIVDRRAYSVSSATDSPNIDLLIRLSESEYSKAVSNLKSGDKVDIIGPMGSEFIPPKSGAVMISGGVGIAPFLSIFRSSTLDKMSLYVFEDKERPIHCKDELIKISESKGGHVYFSQGSVNENSFNLDEDPLDDREVFISGPQGFVDATYTVLLSLGVDKKRMHFEDYYPSLKESSAIKNVFNSIDSRGGIENDVLKMAKLSPELVSKISSTSIKSRDLPFHLAVIWLILLSALLSAIELVLQNKSIPITHYFILFTFIIIIIWNYFNGNRKHIGQTIVGMTFIAIIISRIDSVYSALLEPWILIFPVVASKLSTFRQAMFWDVLYIFILIVTVFLGSYGIFNIQPLTGSVYQYVLAIIFLSVITGIYLYREERHERLLAQNTAEQKILLRQTEEALRLSDMFVKISSQTSNHVVLTDKDGKILYANKASEALTGYSFAEMRGQTPRLWGGLMSPQFYEDVWTQKSHGLKVTHRIINRRRNGQLYVALGRITPIVQNRKVVAYIATEEDITSLMQIDKTKTEFVSLASHQLRTPLSSIGWYSEMLLAGDAGKLTKEQKKYINEIYDGNKRMVSLVNSLLNVSRLDLGTFSVEPELTDFIALARSVMDEQKQHMDERRHKLKTIFAKDIPKILVDQKLMRMVFQNLLSNAIKYTPEGGNLMLSISKNESAKTVDIQMKDSGLGIPKDEQDKIFSKLYRATNARESDTDGTGLGLYIVKTVVETSGGSIHFESAESKGTTFYVSIPLSGMKKKTGTRTLDE